MTQMNFCRTFYPNTKEYTTFSAPHGTFSKIDHILSNKENLNRYKNIRIIPCVLSDNQGLKLEFNNNTNRKLMKTEQCSTDSSLCHGKNKEIKDSQNSMKINAQHTQTYGIP